jgi:hypothetical protein
MTLPLRAELKETPLLLTKHGSYIEMTEGVFQRAEAIDTIKGVMTVLLRSNGGPFQKEFPLNSKGLSDFKSMDRTKLDDSDCNVQVRISINGASYLLVLSSGEDPIKNWEPFAAAVNKAMEQLQNLLVIASPPAPGQPRLIRPSEP